jgi:hypothetical protein
MEKGKAHDATDRFRIDFLQILGLFSTGDAGLVILLYTLSQRNRRLGLGWSVMERGEVGSR